MNMMLSEVYDALMSAGADEAKARLAAEGLATAQDDARRQFSELREDNQKLRTEMAALRGELKSEMAALRGELKSEMAGLRGEMRSDMTAMRGEFKSDMTALRGDFTTLKWMFGALVAMAATALIGSFIA